MELSLSHFTEAVSVRETPSEKIQIDPRRHGLLKVMDAEFTQHALEENAGKTLRGLQGKEEVFQEIFIWNGAFLIFASGKTDSIETALPLARESLYSGKALGVLKRMRQAEGVSHGI